MLETYVSRSSIRNQRRKIARSFFYDFIKKTMEDKIFHLFRTRSNEEVDLDNFLTIRFRFNEEKIFLPQR